MKPYIHMRYVPVRGQQEYCDMIRDISGAGDKDKKVPDYVEATVYSKEEAVIMVGNFSDVKTPDQVKDNKHFEFSATVKGLFCLCYQTKALTYYV